MKTCAVCMKQLPRHVIENCLGKLRARGVTCAKEQNLFFHHIKLGIAETYVKMNVDWHSITLPVCNKKHVSFLYLITYLFITMLRFNVGV
jgi:hypothetical protein